MTEKYHKTTITHMLYSGLAGSSTVAIDVMVALHKDLPQRAVLFGIAPPVKQYINLLEQNNIPWEYVPKNSRLDLFAYVRLAKRLARNSSLVILHGPQMPIHLALKIISPLKNTIIWLHSHDDEFLFPQKYFITLSAILAKQIVCISQRSKKLLASLPFCKVKALRAVIAENSINTDFWKPNKESKKLQDGKLRLCFSGTLTARKRPNYAVDLLRQLCKKGINAKLTFCGDGPLLKELKQKAQNELKDKISFQGLLDREQLLKTYQASDIMIHTSQAEGLSISILEALSCGLPVAGLKEGLEAFTKAPITKAGNIDMLSEQIIQIANEPEKLSTIASQAREYILQNHNLTDRINTIKNVLT